MAFCQASKFAELSMSGSRSAASRSNRNAYFGRPAVRAPDSNRYFGRRACSQCNHPPLGMPAMLRGQEAPRARVTP